MAIPTYRGLNPIATSPLPNYRRGAQTMPFNPVPIFNRPRAPQPGMGGPAAPGQQTNWMPPGRGQPATGERPGAFGADLGQMPSPGGMGSPMGTPGFAGSGGMAGPEMMSPAVMPPGEQTNWKTPGGTVGMQMPPSSGFSDYSNAQPMPMPSPGMGGGMRPGMGGGLFSNLMARFGR